MSQPTPDEIEDAHYAQEAEEPDNPPCPICGENPFMVALGSIYWVRHTCGWRSSSIVYGPEGKSRDDAIAKWRELIQHDRIEKLEAENQHLKRRLENLLIERMRP